MKIQAETVIYALGLILTGVIRSRWMPRGQRGHMRHKNRESRLVPLCMACWGLSQLAALVYVFSPWLDFADYRLPRWTAAVGSVIFISGVVLLWRSHADLGRNFSPFLEIQPAHRLVTEGVYRLIRHPMYAAHALWCVGQALMLPNWLAGPTALAAFAPLYFLRVPREEQIMLDEFGDAYRSYQQRTGRLWPRWRRSG